MDRTGIIVVSICVVLLGFCFVEQQKHDSHLPQTPLNTNAVANAQTPTVNSSPAAAGPGAVFTPDFDTNAPEKMIVISNANARYTFTSRGGGLKLVELNNYPETVSA